MATLIFFLNAILVYLLVDWIVRAIERRRGAPLKHRPLLFFAIFLVLILASFELIERVFG